MRFLALALAVAWFTTFALARADYRSFNSLCNHDPGAVLRTDDVISQGFRPGADFFYYYGLLPLAVSRAFFSIFGRSPLSLLALMSLLSGVSYVGLTRAVAALRPTRLGAILIAIAAGHVSVQSTPTHATEATLLIWALALFLRGHKAGAVALATTALFAKMSMASVLLAGFAALISLDALRARRIRPLKALLAFPVVFGVAAGLCVAWLGVPALANSFDARAGAAIYRAWNLGFLREGRGFWDPAQHNLNWYLGSVAGPWCVGSIVLLFLAIRGVYRLLGAAIRGEAHDDQSLSDEAHALAGFGNLAFVVGFWGPSLSVYNYTWLLLLGLAPIIGRARLSFDAHAPLTRRASVYGLSWLSLGLLLLLSQTDAVSRFARFALARRVTVGQVTMDPTQAEELNATLALGHSVGGGVITALARASNFGLVDPTIREGHYWMLVPGMPRTKAHDEILQLAKSSDAVFVTRFDYGELGRTPEFRAFLQMSERLHEGTRFLLLRPR